MEKESAFEQVAELGREFRKVEKKDLGGSPQEQLFRWWLLRLLVYCGQELSAIAIRLKEKK